MNFKEFYTEQTWYDKVKRSPRKAINFVKDVEQGADETSGLYKLAKGVAKGLGKGLVGAVKLADPFGKQGLLGRAATGAKDIENWMRYGTDPFRSARQALPSGKNIFSAKTLADQQKQISDYRQRYIYPRDNDMNLNRSVSQMLNLPNGFPIDYKQQKSLGFGHGITKRKRPINTASHLANIVMDEFVRNVRNGVPTDKAMNQATSDLNNPQLVQLLRKEKLLPL